MFQTRRPAAASAEQVYGGSRFKQRIAGWLNGGAEEPTDPQPLADRILDAYAKRDDDALVVVTRYKPHLA